MCSVVVGGFDCRRVCLRGGRVLLCRGVRVLGMSLNVVFLSAIHRR